MATTTAQLIRTQAFVAPLTGLGHGVQHADTRMETARKTTGPWPTTAGLYRRYSNTTAGTMQLPSASPHLTAPLLASPRSASDAAFLAAHTLRRKHWWEF